MNVEMIVVWFKNLAVWFGNNCVEFVCAGLFWLNSTIFILFRPGAELNKKLILSKERHFVYDIILKPPWVAGKEKQLSAFETRPNDDAVCCRFVLDKFTLSYEGLSSTYLMNFSYALFNVELRPGKFPLTCTWFLFLDPHSIVKMLILCHDAFSKAHGIPRVLILLLIE